MSALLTSRRASERPGDRGECRAPGARPTALEARSADSPPPSPHRCDPGSPHRLLAFGRTTETARSDPRQRCPMSSTSTGHQPDPGRYEIRVEGRLESRWAAWFDGMTLAPASDGTTTISRPGPRPGRPARPPAEAPRRRPAPDLGHAARRRASRRPRPAPSPATPEGQRHDHHRARSRRNPAEARPDAPDVPGRRHPLPAHLRVHPDPGAVPARAGAGPTSSWAAAATPACCGEPSPRSSSPSPASARPSCCTRWRSG